MSTNEELVMLIREGSTELIPQLWDQTNKLLKVIALRYYQAYKDRLNAAGAGFDDFIQETYFSLLEAVKSYTPDNEFKFNTYLNYSVRKRLRNLMGRQRDAFHHSVSLDEPLAGSDDGDQMTLEDTINDPDVDVEGDTVEHCYIEKLHKAIDKCLGQLTPADSELIISRFYKGMSLQAYAAEKGITAKEASKAFKVSMFKLRNTGKTRQMLRSYRDDIIIRYGYNSSFNSWRDKGSSSVELTAQKLIESGL